MRRFPRTRAGLSWAGCLLSLGFLAGCQCSEDPASGGETAHQAAPETTSAPAEAVAKTIDPSTVGRVQGRVEALGTPRKPEVLPTLGDPFCMQAHRELGGFPDDRILVEQGRLQNAFVWVKSGLEGYQFDPAGLPQATIAQEGCRYSPKVQGIQLGQTLMVSTADATLHNVHSHPEKNREQNFAMPPGSPALPLKFKQGEVMVPIACDVHAWMKCFVGVVEHPFFAVTGADGTFDLAGLPPGDYVLGVWHEMLGFKEVPFSLEPNATLALDAVVFQL